MRSRLFARHQQVLGHDHDFATLVPGVPIEVVVDEARADRVAAFLVAAAIGVDEDLAGQPRLLDRLRAADGHDVVGAEDGAYVGMLL